MEARLVCLYIGRILILQVIQSLFHLHSTAIVGRMSKEVTSETISAHTRLVAKRKKLTLIPQLQETGSTFMSALTTFPTSTFCVIE